MTWRILFVDFAVRNLSHLEPFQAPIFLQTFLVPDYIRKLLLIPAAHYRILVSHHRFINQTTHHHTRKITSTLPSQYQGLRHHQVDKCLGRRGSSSV